MSDSKKETVENPDVYNIRFFDHDDNEVGRLEIRPNKPVKFEGDLDESAEMFFEHLKEKIDNYILDNTL